MIEDHMAKRKTLNIVTFCKGDMFFEYQGQKKSLKKSCDSFKDLLIFFTNLKTPSILNKKYEVIENEKGLFI